MRILKLLKQLSNDFSSIPSEAKNFPGFYLSNFFKLLLDRKIKTIGYIWHFFFRNKVYDEKLLRVGNYKIFPNNISKDSIIYSCGIAKDISFDEAISKKFNCDVFMFDPTEESKKFMATVENPKLKFFNIGIWKFNGDIKFYYHAKNSNLSATNLLKSENFFTLPCKSIDKLMTEHNQNRIDVLKMDIEGASFDILNDLFDKSIYPIQIVAELERPFFIFNSNIYDLYLYLYKRRKLHKRLKILGYEVVELDANEFLAIKNN